MIEDELVFPSVMPRASDGAVGLRPGVAVLANVAASSTFARVVAIEGDGDQRAVTVKYDLGGRISASVLRAADVIVLTEAIGFGQPIAIKEADEWTVGTFVYGDTGASWVLARSKLVSVAPAAVKPMKVQTPFAEGAQVLAERFGRLKPAVVLKVIEAGVAYRVKFEGADDVATVGLEAVTQPL